MHPDRYVLALAMLDGDKAARQVLADMLEEQGERGLAQWAREGRRDKRRTLEFAVMLLSCRPAIGLAAELIGKTSYLLNQRGAKRIVLAAQQWASKRMGDLEAIEACRPPATDWLREGRYSYVGNSHWDRLSSALQHAIESEQLALNGEPARAAARDLESRQYVRQIVRQTGGLEPRMAEGGSMQYVSNLADRLQQLLKTLIASEEDLWPR